MPCEINNNSDYDLSQVKPLVQDLYGYAKDRFGFNKPPSIDFVSDSNNHPLLGKTAHYEPSSMKITVYVDGRHPKDMMRSISHELVHHSQNERGMFDDERVAGEGYAQKDPHLRKMEEEAYLEGNMCFRDWEDQHKSKNKDIFYERRIHKMSTKKWKNKELNTLLNERWGFSMNLDKLNENKNIQEEEVKEINIKNALSDESDERTMDDLKAEEGEKPDYIDLDKDGDKEESMKSAAEDAKLEEEVVEETTELNEEEEAPSEAAEDDLLQKMLDSLTIEQLRAALALKQNKSESGE